MDDYISREAALKEFCDDCMDREWCETYGDSCSRINNINTVPAADVVDVVRTRYTCRNEQGEVRLMPRASVEDALERLCRLEEQIFGILIRRKKVPDDG